MIASRYRLTFLTSALLMIFGAGCNESGPSLDTNLAQELLVTTLESWKSGGTPNELGGQAPVIHVRDFDWQQGMRLIGYRQTIEPTITGNDVSITVSLELKNSKGKTVKKTANYSVSTQPERIVLRQDG